MCETMEIRYVHYMENPRYSGILACGAICAGHMEGNLAEAQERDRIMRNNSSRRKRFPSLQGWYHSYNGNPTIKRGRFKVTVFQRGKIWRGVVNGRSNGNPLYTRDVYATMVEAQIAVFDTLQLAEEKELKSQRGPFNPNDYNLD
jgi:hypothetical protein